MNEEVIKYKKTDFHFFYSNTNANMATDTDFFLRNRLLWPWHDSTHDISSWYGNCSCYVSSKPKHYQRSNKPDIILKELLDVTLTFYLGSWILHTTHHLDMEIMPAKFHEHQNISPWITDHTRFWRNHLLWPWPLT